MDSKTYIHLGRTGDICNLLPLLYQDHMSGQTPELMVSREFAPVLDGVSYVKPVIYEGNAWDIEGAVGQCEQEGKKWICTQVNGPEAMMAPYVYGPAGLKTAVTTSFQKEMWRLAGRLKDWDSQPPLIFDKRDLGREASLAKRYRDDLPIILLAASGVSSPFPYVNLLRELIRLRFGDTHHIVDISEIRCERFYDLLGLYENAYCLISTDSAPLHLAHACPSLPVAALINDSPLLWHGSSWRPQHIFYCRYGDFPKRAVDMLDCIQHMPARFTLEPRILHVWCDYEANLTMSPWLPTPIELGSCGRDSKNTLQDDRRFPFLRDSLRMAIQRARDEDYICLTRPEAQLAPDCEEQLLSKRIAFAYRIVDTVGGGTFQPIPDLFFAPKEFWQTILPEIPDLVFGMDHFWAHVLWAIFSRKGAADLTGCVRKVLK